MFKKMFNVFLLLILVFSLVICYVIFNYFFEVPLSYLYYSFFLLFFIYFSLVFFITQIKKQNEIRSINIEIPYFLNNLASDLDKNIPLRLCLKNRATAQNNALSKKIALALSNVDLRGYTLEQSLLEVSLGYNELERVMEMVIDIIFYGSSNRGMALRTLSDSFLQNQYLLLKNYSTKLNLLTLIYIVISSIIPAMFLIFLLLGSNFLELNFTPLSVLFIIVIVFPLVDMFLLFFMKVSLP